MIKRIPTKFSYSKAVVAGDYIFLGLHRGSGETFTEQIHSAFSELKETVQKCDVSLGKVVKVDVYLKNIQDLPEMEEVFLDYFAKDTSPARMTTTTEFIDSDCLMMIGGVAYTGV